MATANDPLTCVHTSRGLCLKCQAEYLEDPEAYLEFGDHPAGLDNYNALLATLVEAGAVSPDGHDDSHIPF